MCVGIGGAISIKVHQEPIKNYIGMMPTMTSFSSAKEIRSHKVT